MARRVRKEILLIVATDRSASTYTACRHWGRRQGGEPQNAPSFRALAHERDGSPVADWATSRTSSKLRPLI